MTNAPDEHASFLLPDGVDKLSYILDTKLKNAGTFKIEREDHTIGNLLRMQLLSDPDVIFVGYKNPHPLEHHIVLKVQTATIPTGKHGKNPYLPTDALGAALEALQSETSLLIEQASDPSDPHKPS